jgi:tryptophanyl-tRNA synthetase
MQPTGKLHFGRYFGAVQNWVQLQEKFECFYGIVNYHAMTMPYQTAQLREATWDGIFNLMAVGIRPENLFIQSLIPEHAELAWILNCFASYGEAQRMTQFKDKSSQVTEKDKEAFISVGLFTYPVLQAADILIYKPKYVPVGKDQEQHLELTRNIVLRINHFVRKDLVPLPEALFTDLPKLMSTADPSKKMSASLGEKHVIDVFATPDQIRKQIKSAVTDTGQELNETMSPGVENLFALLKASGDMEAYQFLLNDYQNKELKYSIFKEVVAEALVKISEPFRQKMALLQADKKQYKEKIKDSSAAIRKVAQVNLAEIKNAIGLM